MPLGDHLLPSTAARTRPLSAVLLASVLFGALVMLPPRAHADDHCALKCAQRQGSCSATCGQGATCRRHCNDSADACFSRCQKTDAARETAHQRRADKPCLGKNGPRKCTAEEARQMREGREQASKLMCRGKNGETIMCPEQIKQLEDVKKLAAKHCTDTDCKADTSR